MATADELQLDQPDDRTLPTRFAAGEERAFDEVVAEFGPRLARLAHRLLSWQARDEHEVEDVVQEVFVAALRKRKHFRSDASLWTWLAAIAVNNCRSRLRRRKSWRRWFGFQSRDDATTTQHDDQMARSETAQLVRDAVQQLRPSDREVIVLSYLEHQSADDIARIVGSNRNAVTVRLHRARQRLAELLKDLR